MELADMIALQAETDQGCPAPEALLRYREGYAGAEEQAALAAHLAGCVQCQADLESLAYLHQELLQARADRQALENFQPGAEHARQCYAADEGQLLDLSSPDTTLNQALVDHLAVCVYCTCRATMLAAARDGRPTLRAVLLGSLLTPGLRKAEEVVLWSGARASGTLVERLVAKLTDAGQLIATGLSHLLGIARPAAASTMSYGVQAPPEVARWELPLPGREERLVLTVAPGRKGLWHVACALENAADPDLAKKARIQLRRGSDVFLAGNLADDMAAPVQLAAGEWLLLLALDKEMRQVPLSLQ